MTEIRAVIFDCDGTLVDSESVLCDVMSEHTREHGLALSPGEYLREFAGQPMSQTVTAFEHRLGRSLPDDFVPRLRTRMYAAFKQRLQPIPGAVRTVRGMTLPFCVASGGPREKIELNLSIVGLLDAFEGRIFSSYDRGLHKPDPDLFLYAAEALGVAPEHCAVVEDSPTGFAAAQAAGTQLFVFDPHRRYDELAATFPVLHELPQLLDYLR